MTTTSSNIISTTIDPNFPIAGQDNDSQGFRDNFGRIRIALATAKEEISNLQSNVVVKADLVTGEIVDNYFLAGSSIQGVTLNNNNTSAKETTRDIILDSDITVEYGGGNYQIISNVARDTNIYIDSWPDSGTADKPLQGSLRLEIQTTSTNAVNINFPVPAGDNPRIMTEDSLTLPYTATSVCSTIFDVWSSDNGKTTFVKLVGSFTG